jgi:hypothetical protein
LCFRKELYKTCQLVELSSLSKDGGHCSSNSVATPSSISWPSDGIFGGSSPRRSDDRRIHAAVCVPCKCRAFTGSRSGWMQLNFVGCVSSVHVPNLRLKSHRPS